jgi:hypothetical protein
MSLTLLSTAVAVRQLTLLQELALAAESHARQTLQRVSELQLSNSWV